MSSRHILFTLLLYASTLHAQTFKTCVLYHERNIHPFMKEVNQVFSNNKKVLLIKQAVPIDIMKCFQADVEEILIFSHAFEISQDGDVRLGYFTPSTTSQSRLKYNKALNQYYELWMNYKSKNIFPCQDVNSSEIFCSQESVQAREVWNTYYQIRKMKKSDLLYKLVFEYDKKVFNQRPFEILRDTLRQKGPGRLKKIRLISCDADKIFKSYPALEELILENKLVLDIAPQNKLLSFLFNKNVTTVNKKWLARSL